MSTSHITPRLHTDDHEHLFRLYNAFDKKSCLAGLSVAAASFLIIGALIVIGGASLCLTLPGVNAISHIILPAIVPSAGVLLFSIALVYQGAIQKIKQNKERQKLIDYCVALFTYHNIMEMEKREKVAFIKEFFDPNWTREYSSRVVDDIKKRYPSEKETEDQAIKDLHKALDKVKKHLANPNKSKN